MELLPTIQTWVGMAYMGSAPETRYIKAPSAVPEGWNLLPREDLAALFSTMTEITEHPTDSTTDGGRFAVYHDWKDLPNMLIKLYANRLLPVDPVKPNLLENTFPVRITYNFLTISQPIDSAVLKSIIAAHRRLDIEQAVALVLRLLPEHAADLIPLVPTILTKAYMNLDYEIAPTPDVDGYRRKHLAFLFSLSKIQVDGTSWSELASILFRIRSRRPADRSRALRLPTWLHTYYPGNPSDLHFESCTWPSLIIANPIVLSTKHFARITRYIWSLVPNSPAKILRRDINGLKRRLLFAEEKREAIEKTEDKLALAYTFIGVQRRLQLKIVSDLHRVFLKKGEASKFSQNTPWIQTSFEN